MSTAAQVMVFGAIVGVPILCFILIQGYRDVAPRVRRYLELVANALPRD